MKSLLSIAYGLNDFQIVGPSWIDRERFEITATLPEGATQSQSRLMLRSLLFDRFDLKTHPDSRNLTGYVLSVVKNGPKLKESISESRSEGMTGPEGPVNTRTNPQADGNGFPVNAQDGPGIFMMMMPGRTRLTARAQSMQNLADRLAGVLARPVINTTSLTERYDFVLAFTMDGMNAPGIIKSMSTGSDKSNVYVPDGDAPPDLFTAIQTQLGLKLVSGRVRVPVLVIDHVDRVPREN